MQQKEYATGRVCDRKMQYTEIEMTNIKLGHCQPEASPSLRQ